MALSDDQRFSMYTAEEIGNAIKKRRRQLKITQKEFAERLGKSERTIQKYESGEITIIDTDLILLLFCIRIYNSCLIIIYLSKNVN